MIKEQYQQRKIPHPTEGVINFKTCPNTNLLLRDVDAHGGSYKLNENEIDNTICLTLYNESLNDLYISLHSIIESIQCSVINTKTKPEPFTLVIISDGLHHLNKNIIDLFTFFKLLDTKQFECNTRIVMTSISLTTSQFLKKLHDYLEFEINVDLLKSFSINVIFCYKKENSGKLNSHWWFYSFICPNIRAKICYQVDTGTKIPKSAIGDIQKTFSNNSDVGGVAVGLDLLPNFKRCSLLYIWQKVLFLENSIRTWPAEVEFGHLGVLPGQFSALRFSKFVRIDENKKCSPMDSYFRGISSNLSPLEKTLYLAEDRVTALSLNFSTHQDSNLILLENVTAQTDACQDWKELLLQRRRWHLSYISSRMSLFKLLISPTEPIRIKNRIIVALAYHLSKAMLDWFVPFLYFSFLFSIVGLFFEVNGYRIQDSVYVFIFLLSIFAKIYILAKNRLNKLNIVFFIFLIYFHSVAVFFLSCNILLSIFDISSSIFIFNLFVLAASYPLLTIIRKGSGNFKKMIEYYVLSPFRPAISFSLWCYAVFNCHDFSWGTKGIQNKNIFKASGNLSYKQTLINVRNFRVRYVTSWIFSNLILFIIVTNTQNSFEILNIVLSFIALHLLLETVFSIYHFYKRKFHK